MAKRERLSQSAYLKMELCIKESGLWMRIRRMEEEFKFGQMGLDMTDSGETVWLMAMVDLYTQREMCMRENGLKIRLMDMVSILTLTEVGTRDNGSKINNMALVSNNGPMEQNTKVNMNKV